jgi:hypothetical protein
MNRKQTPFTKTRRQHPIPFEIDGSFSWLKAESTHKDHVGIRSTRRLPSQLKHAVASAAAHQLLLPDVFLKFCRSSNLQSHFRSATDCYVDVGRQILTLDDGFLLRFLVDSQGCAYWYLYMRPGTSEHAVVYSTNYFDANDKDSLSVDELSQKQFVYDSPSLECFLCRFWLENEIFFAEDEETEPPRVGKKFLRLYSFYNEVFE